MNAPALGFHDEEQIIAAARERLMAVAGQECPLRQDYASLLAEYEKLFRQSMRLVKMGDRMQHKLANLNEALQHKQKELECMAATDALTGLCNRRAFMEHAHQELSRAARHQTPLSLLLLDADKFKTINDTYGHDVGDRVLQRLAEVGRHSLRAEDLFARFGGEEFVAILPGAGEEDALTIAERLRQDMEDVVVPLANGEVRFTVSIGVASHCPECNTVEQLIKAADLALYVAKRDGRNRVMQPPSPSSVL